MQSTSKPFKARSHLEETLCKLYLRLNGYFVTNLIIHSNIQGTSSSELDIIGVRFPSHFQDDRKVNSSAYLELANDKTEIIIADVKGGSRLEFNDGLRKQKESVEKLLAWIGIFSDKELGRHIDLVHAALNDIHKDPRNSFRIIDCNLSNGLFRLKFTFFAINKAKPGDSDIKYIHGQEVLDYCWTCLRTNQQIDSCSRQYDYTLWGEFEKLVRYFKEKRVESPGNFKDLYSHFSVTK